MIWRQVWYKDLIHYVKCKTYISVYMYTNVVCIKLSLQCDHVLMIMLPAEPPPRFPHKTSVQIQIRHTLSLDEFMVREFRFEFLPARTKIYEN